MTRSMKLYALKQIRSSVGTIKVGSIFEADEQLGQKLINSLQATTMDHVVPVWSGLSWPGATVVVIASGPSLTDAQCELVRRWRQQTDSARVITVNTSFSRAPWADVVYAGDGPWWRTYGDAVRNAGAGALWSIDKNVAQLGVNVVASARGRGLPDKPGVINQGGNSGFQAVSLAALAGAKRIVLLGFDMREVDGASHWHAPHPELLDKPMRYEAWIEAFADLARDLKARGVEVVNCTPDSALPFFVTAALSEVLGVSDLPHQDGTDVQAGSVPDGAQARGVRPRRTRQSRVAQRPAGDLEPVRTDGSGS